MSVGRNGPKPAAASDSRQSSSGRYLGLDRCRIDETIEADRDAVPAVDDHDCQRELDPLLFCEVGLQGFVRALVGMSFGESCEGLGPPQRGTLAIGITRRVAPGREQVDALLRFALLTRGDCMEVDAVSEAVDL